MPLPHQHRKVTARRFGDTINKIQNTLEMADDELRDILMLSKRSFTLFRKNPLKLPAASLYCLGEKLDLSVDSIVSGEIDYRALLSHSNGREDYLPER